MAYEPLTPLPFLPIPGLFNLNTFIPGSSDYEIMAKLVETYNHAVELFNQIINQYSDIDKTIDELTKEYQKQLDEYKADTDANITNFEQNVNQTVNNQNSKIAELAETVTKLQKDVDDLIKGEYIDNYVKALATWIDNNLQQLVAKVVKYVWFEVDDSGYFIAYIPDTWDFADFGTELDPDNEDYGKLVLEWEPEVVTDAAYSPFPVKPVDSEESVFITSKDVAMAKWKYQPEDALSGVITETETVGFSFTVDTPKKLKTIMFNPYGNNSFTGDIRIYIDKGNTGQNYTGDPLNGITVDENIPANTAISISITPNTPFTYVGVDNTAMAEGPDWYHPLPYDVGYNYFNGILIFNNQ